MIYITVVTSVKQSTLLIRLKTDVMISVRPVRPRDVRPRPPVPDVADGLGRDAVLPCKMRGRVRASHVDLGGVLWRQYDAGTRTMHRVNRAQPQEVLALLRGPVRERVLDPRRAVPDVADGPRRDAVLCSMLLVN